MRLRIITRPGLARAARTWGVRRTWASPAPRSSWSYRKRPPGGSSTTCTGRGAAAARCMSLPARRESRKRRSASAPACAPWPCTWSSSSTFPSSGAGPAGTKKYVLGAFTGQYSLFFLGQRTLESFRDFGILTDFGGIVVSDRYANYFHSGWEHLAGHQACLAHILRDFQDAAESWPDAIWPAQAQRALRGLITAWHSAREQGLAEIPAATAGPLIKEFRHAVLAGLSDVPRIPGPKHSTGQHPGRGLPDFCSARQDDVLRFATDTRIWPTNNISERGVRPLKTQQKISGRLTSENATQDRLDIRSYIDTARKHGQDVLTVIKAAMTGTPWQPPALTGTSP